MGLFLVLYASSGHKTNDYETRIRAIKGLLENRDKLSDKEKMESMQKYNEIHYGMGENIAKSYLNQLDC